MISCQDIALKIVFGMMFMSCDAAQVYNLYHFKAKGVKTKALKYLLFYSAFHPKGISAKVHLSWITVVILAIHFVLKQFSQTLMEWPQNPF